MISIEMQDCLNKITNQQTNYDNYIVAINRWKKDEIDAREHIVDLEKQANNIEIVIDKLQLRLRTILNGEESPIPLEMPKETGTEMIGREG